LKSPVSLPALGLFLGAAIWGVVWYPYRVLAEGGIDGIWASLLTYGFALVAGVAAFPRHALALRHAPPLAILLGLAVGWSNLAYVMAVLEGEVMRVLLLFYLAPLWTVPLARFFLHERLDGRGLLVMGLAFAGALVMLWHPASGLPWPQSRPEWLGLGAGFCFALGNVLVRRLSGMSDASKSMVIWAGVVVAALIYVPSSPMATGPAFSAALAQAPLVAAIGIALIALSFALQYGLSRLPANRAIVILLSELVIAAVAAYLLAGETLRPQDWIGGALIVAATLASARTTS
jgi:drug/metabolite transporter (DMT)-like permease